MSLGSSKLYAGYSSAVAMNEVLPQAVVSAKDPRPLASSVRGGFVVSTSSDQGASGRVSFQVPMNKPSVYLPGQWYLKFNLAITGTNDNHVFFNASRDASALIRKITITLGGVVVETIDQYHHLVAQMENHTAAHGFRNNDLRILAGAGATEATTANNLFTCIGNALVAGNTVSQSNLILPLMVGFLNARQGIPSYLLNAPMVIDIELNPIAAALVATTNADPPVAGTAPTAYTVSNARLYYQEAVLDDAFVNRVRADMAGKNFQIVHSTWLNTQLAASAAISQIYGVNYASLNGVFFNTMKAEAATALTSYKSGADGAAAFPFANVYTEAQAITNQISKFDVYLDGRKLNQHDIDSNIECFAHLQRTLGILWDSQYASSQLQPLTGGGTIQNNVQYLTKRAYGGFAFWASQNCRRYLDSDMSFSGSSVQTVQIDINRTHTASDLLNIYFNYDQVVSIDGMGMVSVNK